MPDAFPASGRKNHAQRTLLFLVLLTLVLAACGTKAPARLTPSAPTPASLSTVNCEAITAAAPVTCIVSNDNTMLIQANTQVRLRLRATTLTFDSTFWLSESSGATILPLEGSVVVGLAGQQRVVMPGMLLAFDLSGSQPLAEPQPYDLTTFPDDLLELLPRPVSLPRLPEAELTEEVTPAVETTPEAESTPENTPESTPTDRPGCETPEGWDAVYTVQRGDTLYRIATNHTVLVNDLAAANCISVDKLLSPGDTLRVPGEGAEIKTPGARFYSDRQTIPPGECTLLVWDVTGARQVTLDGEEVESSDTREVCPGQSAEYTLRVRFTSGLQAYYKVVVPVVLELEP